MRVVNAVTVSTFMVSVVIPVFAPTSDSPKPLAAYALEWAAGGLLTSPFDLHSVFDYSLALCLLSPFLAAYLLDDYGTDLLGKVLASISVPIVAIASYEFAFQGLSLAVSRQGQFIFSLPYLPIFVAWLAMAANLLPYARTRRSVPLLFLFLTGSSFAVWLLEGFHQIYTGDYVLAWVMNVISKASVFGLLLSALATDKRRESIEVKQRTGRESHGIGAVRVKAEIAVIVPALNEEESIEQVVGDIPGDLVSEIVVVDNGSTDRTGAKARKTGAKVIVEHERGYGRACMAGVKYLEKHRPSIIVFLDADYSDPPTALPNLVQPVLSGEADLVLASRAWSKNDRGALPWHVFAANRIFAWMINHLYHLHLTDLGPFRAIRWDTLKALNMSSETYGWSSEMIVKAAKMKARITEIPVACRKRMGHSKISGTVRGSLKAASWIFYNILRYCLS